MTGHVVALVQDYLTLRRGLGYRSPVRERALRASPGTWMMPGTTG
jgi:hypothetical protein